MLLLLLFFIFLHGCASRTTQIPYISEPQSQPVVESFYDMLTIQQNCGCCLDAEADVTLSVSRWLGNRTAILTGYLQVMAPSFLKFVGVDPLGQPQILLVTDGDTFHWVVVPDATGYHGKVTARTFQKYSPVGINLLGFFYLFTGRIHSDSIEILGVKEEPEKDEYWLDFLSEQGTLRNSILFDSVSKVVLKYVIADQEGKIFLAVSYDDYQEIAGCMTPGYIKVDAPSQNGGGSLVLGGFLPDSNLSESDFYYQPPVGFKRVLVE